MSKRYIFNPKLLRFEKKTTSFGSKVLKYATIVIFYIASLFCMLWFTFDYWNTPREKIILLKQRQIEESYSRLKDQIDKISESLNVIEKRDNEVYRSIFEVDPIPYDVRIKNITGEQTNNKITITDRSQLIELMDIQIQRVANRLEVQAESLKDIAKYAKTKKAFIRAIPAIQPISNQQLIRFSSGFGYRRDPIYKVIKMHAGVDFSAPTGTPIYATANGVVSYAGYKANGYGRHVIINHGYGYKTLYAHMSRTTVKRRKRVTRGSIIGYVGSTGKSTAPHLHYEVSRNGKKVNPIYFFYSDLDEEQFDELLKRAQINNQSFD